MSQDKEVDVFTDNIELNGNKGLNELKINEGIDLYVEDKTNEDLIDQNSGEKFSSKWE